MILLESGDYLLIRSSNGYELECIIETVSGGASLPVRYILASAENPYKRLHLMNEGIVWKASSSPNRDTLLVFESLENEEQRNEYIIRTYSPIIQKIDNQKYYQYLSCTNDGEWHCLSTTSPSLPTLPCFSLSKLKQFNNNNNNKLQHDENQNNILYINNLSSYSYKRFYYEGYLTLNSFINDSKLLSTCSAYLLHQLGLPNSIISGGIQGQCLGKLKGSISSSSIIRSFLLKKEFLILLYNLFYSSTIHNNSISNSIIMSIENSLSLLNGQIALRFPEKAAFETAGKLQHGDDLGKTINSHVIYSLHIFLNFILYRMAY